MTTNYYYIVMSQKDLLENQVIEEILRERTGYYLSKKRNKDFWILISPNFVLNDSFNKKIQKTNFYKQQRNKIIHDESNVPFYISIVSTNLDFIRWIKLRLGYFEDIEAPLQNDFKSDGIEGILPNSNNGNILNHKPNLLHPDILTKQYKTSLNLYYSIC